MGGTIAPFPRHQFFDDNGVPLAGGFLYTYLAGSTVLYSTYSDVDLTTANADPVVLDAAGRATLFLAEASYKFILKNSSLVTIWTQDNITAVPQLFGGLTVVGVSGQALAANAAVFLSDGTAGLTPGTWYNADADAVHSSAEAQAIGFAIAGVDASALVTVRTAGRMLGFSSLVAGSTYYESSTAGAITATKPVPPAFARVVGVADSTTSLILGEGKPADYRRVASFYTTVINAGAGEDILADYVAPPGELSAVGMAYQGMFWGQTANTANVKTLRLRLIEGANNAALIQFAPTVNEAGDWVMEFVIIKNATTTARTVVKVAVGPLNGPVSRTGTAYAAPTVTWANAVTIRLTGEATADGDTNVSGGLITLVP